MKTIFGLSLILLSQLSLAEVLPREEAQQVAQAVKESLDSSDLQCKGKQRNTKASNIDWSYLTTEFSDAVRTVSVSNDQPSIIVTVGNESSEVIATFTTNEDDTSIIKVQTESFEITKVRKNTGTLLKPRYEDIITRKPLVTMICE